MNQLITDEVCTWGQEWKRKHLDELEKLVSWEVTFNSLQNFTWSFVLKICKLDVIFFTPKYKKSFKEKGKIWIRRQEPMSRSLQLS